MKFLNGKNILFKWSVQIFFAMIDTIHFKVGKWLRWTSSDYDRKLFHKFTKLITGLSCSFIPTDVIDFTLKKWLSQKLCSRFVLDSDLLRFHDDVIKWKHFPHYWPFVRGIHRSPVNSHTKASDAELWCFFYLHLKKPLSKQSWGRWFETLLRPLWRHCNVVPVYFTHVL